MEGTIEMKKCLVFGFILLFFSTNIISNSSGITRQKDNNILQMNRSIPCNETITDTLNDVWTLNYTTQETDIVTDHPDIEVTTQVHISGKAKTYLQGEILLDQ